MLRQTSALQSKAVAVFLALIFLASASSAFAQAGATCHGGKSFGQFLGQLEQDATKAGVSQRALAEAQPYLAYDQGIVNRDRGQRVFGQIFTQFAGRMAADFRMQQGKQHIQRYAQAFARFDDLCAPYATVVDIDRPRLPPPREVARWTSRDYVAALAHDQTCKSYNPDLRQLVHVGYKVAAEMGERYYQALDQFEGTVAERVTANLFDRHIRPLFLGN